MNCCVKEGQAFTMNDDQPVDDSEGIVSNGVYMQYEKVLR